MRVLYLTDWFDTPNHMLVENLASRPGVSVSAMFDFGRPHPDFSARVERVPFRSRGKLHVAAIRELRARIVAGDFDVLHATNSRMLANALLATRGLAGGPKVSGFIGHIGRFSRWNAIHQMTYLHPRVAAVWCNCHAVSRPLVRGGVPREKLFVIHAGHPFRERPAPPDLDVRRELGIPADAVVVGFAGNMRPVKGVDVLMEAALRLQSSSAIHWLLLGRVEDAKVKELSEHPAIRDRVHCLGWRDDAERLLPAMDIFAMPSRSEGFSRAITEAMELGLCPVATRVGGTPELVRDGVDGLLTPVGDAAALANAIRRVAEDAPLRARLAASARERIRTEFTVEHMGEQAMWMFRSMLAGRIELRVWSPAEDEEQSITAKQDAQPGSRRAA